MAYKLYLKFCYSWILSLIIPFVMKTITTVRMTGATVQIKDCSIIGSSGHLWSENKTHALRAKPGMYTIMEIDTHTRVDLLCHILFILLGSLHTKDFHQWFDCSTLNE